jgi:hypothetical protein
VPSREYTICPRCHARVILTRHCPPADWTPNTAGQLAIEHTVSGAYVARFLAKGEQPLAGLEKRHAVHDCPEAAQPVQEAIPGVTQLDAWRQAQAGHGNAQRSNRSGRRPARIVGFRRRTP